MYEGGGGSLILKCAIQSCCVHQPQIWTQNGVCLKDTINTLSTFFFLFFSFSFLFLLGGGGHAGCVVSHVASRPYYGQFNLVPIRVYFLRPVTGRRQPKPRDVTSSPRLLIKLFTASAHKAIHLWMFLKDLFRQESGPEMRRHHTGRLGLVQQLDFGGKSWRTANFIIIIEKLEELSPKTVLIVSELSYVDF